MGRMGRMGRMEKNKKGETMKKSAKEALIREILQRALDNLVLGGSDGNYHEDYENWRLTLTPTEYSLIKKYLDNQEREGNMIARPNNLPPRIVQGQAHLKMPC